MGDSNHTATPKPSAMGDLTNPERQKYLTAIDRLRELGLNEEISLPQLVVVGDQSSGKSSLLEGITGFSFPVASDLCTRFATQIVMRRAQEDSVSISIIPGPSSRNDEALKEKYESYGKSLRPEDLKNDAFQEILGEASLLMGLPATLEESAESSAKRFSDDVLKIEICGLEQDNLSVVDVPGLFHNPTKYQTKADREIIRSLIGGYMNDPRTIILAVMDGRNNLANQEVFEMARKADPEGARTVAAITKCDALQPGDEEQIMRIAHNEVEVLRHGWWAVRNRTTKEIEDGVTISERHEVERNFLNTKPWHELQSDHRGVPELKKYLGLLLYDHIRREFPQVVKDIESRRERVRHELERLGEPRKTVIEQRRYLTKIASSYASLVEGSLSGQYDSTLEGDHPLKLRMRLRKIDDDFEETLRKDGHAKAFCKVDNTLDTEYAKEPDANNGDIRNWIKNEYRDSRGAELPGTVNPMLLEKLFRQLTEPWEKAEFNEAAHATLISDDRLRGSLLALHAEMTRPVSDSVTGQLKQLLVDERGGILQTLNHYFADTLQAIRRDRILARLRASGYQSGHTKTINMEQLLGAAHLSNEDQAVNDIHDILKAYYKVAQKRFLDGVLITVRERCLVKDSSLRKFTPEYISNMEDEKMSQVAEESSASSRQREQVMLRFEMLRDALEIVREM